MADRASRPIWRPSGPVADARAAYVLTNDIDLVVMTMHGRGGLTRLWLGRTAFMLAHQITVPLLLVRPEKTAPDLAALRTFHRMRAHAEGAFMLATAADAGTHRHLPGTARCWREVRPCTGATVETDSSLAAQHRW